jgi:hypothetical protein
VGLVTVIAAGSRLLAERLAEWSDQINELTAPGWTDWSSTFALQASTSNPTLGNSTKAARYRRVDGADVVDFEFRIVVGSTFSAGSGSYRFTVPFNASADAILQTSGTAYVLDNGTANRHLLMRFEAAGYLNMFLNNSTGALASGGSGTAWATGDILSGTIRYEPA